MLLLTARFSLAITGKIVDEKANPLAQVAVSSSDKVVFSNEQGNFYFPEDALKDSLRFYKFGFQEKKLSIHSLPKIILLEKKPFELETLYVQEEREIVNQFHGAKKEIVQVKENEQRDLASLLSEKATIFAQGESLSGEIKEISLFGNKAKHTLILLDGIPLNKSGESFDISAIPANLIEKIEIIPHSSTSGSGAIGGAINFITRKENENSISYQQILGSYGLHSEKWQLNAHYRNLYFSQNITWQNAENDFSYQYIFSDSLVWKKRENNRRQSFDSFSQLRLYTKTGEWRLQISHQDFYKELPGQTNQISKFDSCHLDGTTTRYIFEQNGRLKSILWQTNMYHFDEKTIFDNRFSSSGSYRIKAITEYDKYGAQLNFKEAGKGFWNFFFHVNQEMFDYEVYDVTNEQMTDQSIKKVKRTNWASGGAFHFSQKFFPFFMEEHVSIRYDGFSDSNQKQAVSWRGEISIGHENLLQNELNFSMGNAFAVPSFYDLYWKGDYQTVGNPDLHSEYSQNWQISWKTAYLLNSFAVSYHVQRIEDMIYWRQSVSYWKPDNLGAAEIKNIQLELSVFPISWLKINSSYLQTSALDKTKMNGENGSFYNQHLIYTPTSQTVINSEFKWKKWQLSASYQRTGKQWVTQDNLFGTLPAYEIVNTSIQKEISFKKWEILIQWQGNNLLDKPYEVYTRMPKAGFHWQSGLQVRYGF
jgi:outer membrane cobalamin receptor